jgi:sugar phosphate isomerase/epimerase
MTPTRREVLATLAGAAALSAAPAGKRPVGLELFSVRGELQKDLMGTVRAVAKMGYDGVEFYSPYMDWTPAYAKDVRKLLDDVGMKCLSTHNRGNVYDPENLGKAIELNQIIGSRYVVMASAGKVEGGLDGWKKVADKLTAGAERLKAANMRAGFHNHQTEFQPINGTRPMDVLAKNTPKSVVLQLDVGTCVHAGSDPVAWIEQNPGRIVSMHLKDYAPDDRAYKVLFGEGASPWKRLFAAAEKVGGIEYYLIEQEGSRYPELETAQRCLDAYKKMRA